MKTIIISDLHNRVNWIEPFLSSIEYDKVIFLGDYFDDFNDRLKDVAKVAIWLQKSLKNSNRIHLMGTHDMYYRFSLNHNLMASGNTNQKESIINSILTKEDWEKIKLFHYEQDFLLTHAGLHLFIISNEDKFEVVNSKYKIKNIQQFLDLVEFNTNHALIDAKHNDMNCWIGAGEARGGFQTYGGITWLDWNEEFMPIPNLNQIVGHTTFDIPQENHTKNSKNYCIDTKNKHIGILENGNFTWIKNKFFKNI